MEAQCQCGNLRALVTEGCSPGIITLCHCGDCQRRSGSPFGVIAYFSKDAVSVHGTATEFERGTYSGNRLSSGFCPVCGSTIYVLLSKNPDMIGVPVGAFSEPAFPAPHIAVWEQDRHDWIELPAKIGLFERGTDLK